MPDCGGRKGAVLAAVQQGGRQQLEEPASQACGHWDGHGARHLCPAEQDVQLRYRYLW